MLAMERESLVSQLAIIKPMAKQQESRAALAVREIFASGRPLTYIRSAEEQRVVRLLREVSDRIGAPLFTWSQTEGMEGARTAREALDFIIGHTGTGVFHLKDFHEALRDSAEVRRRLRDVYEQAADKRKYVVVSSPVRFIPEELERSMIFLELRPPDTVELVQFLKEETSASEETLNVAARALQGLTLDEARYAIRRALAVSPELGPESFPALLEEKRLLVNRSGVIEYIPTETELAEVGGLEGMKTWLLERRKLFQMRDSLSEEIVPKGILIMGIPGCGKSLTVKATASYFGLPLYRVDMVEIFSGRHGKPEGAFVAACRMMEDMAPAVLWFDEIEMGINSAESGGEQGRIFAFFLTWMQEKTKGLFVAATANRIDLLPAEMIRKGRFDEVFFVDIPLEDEQTDILKIHLKRRGVDASGFDLSQITKFTVGWTGAEIEQCVVSAVTKAKLADRAVTQEDLILIAAKMVPLSRTMKEQINQIRGWAFERAVKASAPQVRR